jgi:hypothetical protein
MGCNCGDGNSKELNEMGERDERLPAIYNHSNIGKHMVHGHATRTKYGFLGGGRVVPNGVLKADIRVRPDLYICANCRESFVITSNDVYCGNCAPAQISGLTRGKPQAVQKPDSEPQHEVIPQRATPPPPPDISTQPVLLDRTLDSFDFGGTRHAFIVELLDENDIRTDSQARELGVSGLVKIKGIGEKTAKDILSAIDSA